METYRLSSKLKEQDSEFLIQTANSSTGASIQTTVYVNGTVAERIAQPHPEEIDPQDVLALVKRSHGEKKKEIELLLGSYRSVLDQDDPETMHQLGTAFFYKGFYKEARELFSGASLASTDFHQAFNLLGITELMLLKADEAVLAASRAVSLRPRFADYRNNLGEAYLAQTDWQSAIREFGEALEINMYYSDAYLNMALARIIEAEQDQDQHRWPDRKKTIEDNLRKASLIYDKYTGELLDEGLAALDASDLSTALSSLQTLRETKREAARRQYSSMHLNTLLFPNMVSEQAILDRIGFLHSEISKNPNYVDLQSELALCYLELARLNLQKSTEQYRRATATNPSLRKVSRALAETESLYDQVTAVLARITEKG
jgi:tetratricopeptide (TPR) repeat protein